VIRSILACKFHALRRDRIASMLVFLLPILFFSIFAGIFGNVGNSQISGMTVLVVDESKSDRSQELIAALKKSGAGIQISLKHGEPAEPWTTEEARAQVAAGRFPAMIVIPSEFSVNLFGPVQGSPVSVVADPSNPIAATMIPGLLQQAAMTGLRAEMVNSGIQTFAAVGGPLTERQKAAMQGLDRVMESTASNSSASNMPLPVVVENIRSERGGEARPMMAYYVAGIGVMFLLFSTTGAAGSLLEDQEAGILDRVLSTPLGMSRLLIGNWLWISILGMASMTVLFLFATLAFGLGPWTWPRVIATFLMTLMTASAAAGFGMLLASLCRTRAQLSGISTIVILVMSALGGSMVPRFIMPEAVQNIGFITFNAWAVEGYLDVFWYSARDIEMAALLRSMWLPLVVLFGMTMLFMALARMFSRRWETT